MAADNTQSAQPKPAKQDKEDPKAEVKTEAKPEAKPEAKAEAKPETKAEAKPEAKAEAKPEAKAEAKPEAKAEAKPETKAEAKPEAKAEAKPEAKAEAKPETKAEAKAAAQPVEPGSRVGRATAVIRRNVLWSLGAGAVPIPFLDAFAVTGVQLKMLAELSELYGVKFSDDVAKKLIGSLLSSLGGVTLGAAIGGSIAKLVPTVGTALGLITVPIVAGAFTHATGKVFLMHFESGGTILDFDPHAVRAHFRQEFERAKETVARMHDEHKAKAEKPS